MPHGQSEPAGDGNFLATCLRRSSAIRTWSERATGIFAGGLLVHSLLVVLFPPVLTGRIAVSASADLIGAFDLVMAVVMPAWIVGPIELGIDHAGARLFGAAEAMAALLLVGLAGRSRIRGKLPAD